MYFYESKITLTGNSLERIILSFKRHSNFFFIKIN